MLKLIKKLVEQLLAQRQVIAQPKHFKVFMNKCGLMIDLKNLHLDIRKEILMTYLLYFITKKFFLAKLTIFLSSKLGNIKFNYEKESSNSLPFLDVLTLCSENYFRISIFHKLTFRLVHSNSLNRLISYQCKIGLVFALLFRTF